MIRLVPVHAMPSTIERRGCGQADLGWSYAGAGLCFEGFIVAW